MIYGAHVAAKGDFLSIPKRAKEMNADIIQIFAGSPRTWRQKTFTPQEGESFKEQMKLHSRTASYIHMLYLTSYGTTDDALRQRSIDGYAAMLETSDTLGCIGVVTHLGSHKGDGFDARVQSLADGIVAAIDKSKSKSSYVIIENSAGQGGVMGNSIDELAKIYELSSKHPKIKFCLDTAHLMGSGVEFRTEESLNKLLDDFDKKVGLEHLILWHINDSKVDLGERKDRHENIGDGFVGLDGFKPLLNSTRTKDVHSVLEVPGIAGDGPDAENIKRLIKLTN